MDPNDSDGSWEFVDHKDSDSDASSVASPYDTGLPEENLATLPSQNEESVGSAWNNHDDFITDSDIEACAEDPPESDDGDGDITLKQDTLPSSPQIDKDDLALEMQSSGEHGSQSSSSTITKSVTAMEDENPPQMVAETCDDINTSAISETDCQQNDNTSPEDADHPSEEVTSQEITIKDASLVDDITVPLIDSEQTPAVLESLQLPPISSASSESSDFERIDSTSDLTSVTTNSDLNFEPDVLQSLDLKPEEGEVPSIEIESFSTGEDQDSDEGSITFAVISAPPPTEIISHKIATSVIFGDDSTNQRSVGMVTEAALAKHNLVDMATEPDMANQKTVGMVTEQAGPPNQRLLISFIALSFGVGFLLGATVPMSQSTVWQYPEEIVALEEKEIPPFSLRDIYKESENPLTKGGIERNDFMKYKLFMENSRLRNKNRGLRSNIRKLKEENNKFMTKQSDKTTDAERSSIALALLQKSLQKSQELNKIEFEKRDKEIMKLQTELQVAEDENTFMTTRMDLYKRLQAQHSELTALHEKSLRAHAEEKDSLLERQQSLKHRLHRYRTESRNLIQQSNKLKSHNLHLKSIIQSYESRQQSSTPVQSEPTKTLSPLMLAFAARRQKTCPSSSKFRSQVKLLQLRLRRQRSKMRKLEQKTHLKSIALEKLYNTMGDLSNYAICLGQQLKMPLNERAKDPVGYCRSTSNGPRSASSLSSLPKNYPQCSYHVNGTLAVDFSSLNVTVKGFKDTTSYKLQILSDRTTPAIYFNSSVFIEKPITLAPSCDNNPHDLELTLDTNTTSVFGPKFVPAHLYAHVVTKNVRARREISNHKAEFLSLLRTISVNNQSLDVSRKETENAENRLVVANRELKRLRKEKKDLNQKLKNVTSELKKKPTMKQCLQSALDTDQLLNKVNDTKAYKRATKMAQKVKKATDKAWDKLKNFVNKFGESDEEESAHGNHREFRNHHHHHHHTRKSGNFHGRFKHRHEKSKSWSKKHEFDDDEDHDEFEHHSELKKSHKPNHGKWKHSIHSESNKDKNHKVTGPELDKERKVQNSEKVFGPQRRIYPEEFKKENDDDNDEDQKLFFNRRFEKKQQKNDAKRGKSTPNLDRGNFEECKKGGHKKSNDKFQPKENHKKRRHQQKWGRRTQQFREMIGKHVNLAKEAGKKVATSLMPIYDKWQKVYCDIEKKILPKSFTEIWESLGNEESMRNVMYGPVSEHGERKKSTVNWGWEIYNNFTDLMAPVIQLPEKIEFPSWETSEEELIQDSDDEDDDAYDDDEDFLFEDDEPITLEDPQWFTHMFKARENLRKDWGDSPLSEEEFDWFLRMFEGREELRKSGEKYPSNHGNDDELDWFLKMFEARARLRFENKEDEKNWYLKMAEARNKARSKVDYEGSEFINWYEKMSKAREKLRKQQERKVTRGEQNGDWFLKRMKSRQKSRENDDDEEWCLA